MMSSGLRSRSALWLTLSAIPVFCVLLIAVLSGASRLSDLRPALILAAGLSLVALLAGWAVLFIPMFSRLNKVSEATERLVSGDVVGRIDDRIPDEIGTMAQSLDQLAQARDEDQRSRVETEEQLTHQSTHDPLTGIRNRQHLAVVIDQELRANDGRTVSVLFVDLDDFRLVNELWGHSVGDEVLVSTSNRLRRLVGNDVEFGRWSADEFLLVLNNVEPAEVAQLATRVRALFDEPFNTSAGPHPLACSVGTATMTAGTGTIDQLLHDADVTMQDEKLAHRRSRQIDPETARLVELALSDNRLEVWYQPIVQMSSPTETRMVGAEAFVRLRADDNTLRVPSEFLSEIMTSRYAREIDKRMASLVLANLSLWQTRGMVSGDFLVSLNLSPASLRDAELGRTLLGQCQDYGVAPTCIVLDVSEEAGELDPIIAAELRQYGFRLSIDDLGLKRSNFDRLFSIGAEFAKLHRRWLDDDIMLDALVNICQRKGLQVVAEGVETMAQLELLFSRGVRMCQGYVISRPISVDQFVELLGAGRQQPQPT